MLPNGLMLTLDMALGMRFTGSTFGRRAYCLMVLGMLREDVIVLPFTAKALPSPSFGHIWPMARFYFTRRYRRAVSCARKGKPDKALFELGRALHVLIDMGCPAHARATWHYLRDPFEHFVDHHATTISVMDLPYRPEGDAFHTPAQLVTALAQEARREQADRTQTLLGAWLRKRGRRRELSVATVRRQVERLIPLTAMHCQELLALFSRDSGIDLEVQRTP